MINRSRDEDQPGGDRLFQGMDEQERLYAPEQVPGAVGADVEVDQGGTAALGAANTNQSPEAGDVVAGPLASGDDGADRS